MSAKPLKCKVVRKLILLPFISFTFSEIWQSISMKVSGLTTAWHLGDPTHSIGVNLIERWLIFRLSEVQEHSNLKFEWFES